MTRSNDDFEQGLGGSSARPKYVGENASTGVLHKTLATVVNGRINGGAPLCSNSPRTRDLYRVREYDPSAEANRVKCQKCFPNG